ADLSGYSCDDLEAALAAAGVLVAYCRQTQQSALAHVTGLRVERESEFVLMDAATRRNLEITETIAGAEAPTLFSLLDRCATSMGTRSLRHPDIARALAGWSDVERITARVALAAMRPREAAGLRDTLAALPTLHAALVQSAQPALEALAADLAPAPDMLALLATTLKDEP